MVLFMNSNTAPETLTARAAKPSKAIRFTWQPCTGAAHSEAYIDHCGLCLNHRWGFLARPAPESAARFAELTAESQRRATTRFVNAFHKAAFEAQLAR